MKELDPLQIGSRSYRVIQLEKTDPENANAEGDICYSYRLVGERAEYLLMRNEPNPAMMFAIHADDFTKKSHALCRTWFTDKNRDGTPCPLRVV